MTINLESTTIYSPLVNQPLLAIINHYQVAMGIFLWQSTIADWKIQRLLMIYVGNGRLCLLSGGQQQTFESQMCQRVLIYGADLYENVVYETADP